MKVRPFSSRAGIISDHFARYAGSEVWSSPLKDLTPAPSAMILLLGRRIPGLVMVVIAVDHIVSSWALMMACNHEG